MKVRNWDNWDLSSDVILNCVDEVRGVTLYSSGNNSVLLGWSSPAGLPKLEKVRHLCISASWSDQYDLTKHSQLKTVKVYVKEVNKCLLYSGPRIV